MYPYQTKVLIFVQLSLLFVSTINAHPDGNVEESCTSMDPSEGHGGASSTDPCIYETITDMNTLAVGGSLTVTLRNLTSYSFKGYMTMAFDASKPDNAGPIGTFSIPSSGQTLNCTGGTSNAISHKDSSIKKNITAVWTAPTDFVGTVVFKTTFVRGTATYWVKEPSNNVTIGASEETTLPIDTTKTTVTLSTTPTCGSANLVSSYLIVGFILSSLAYTIHF